MKHQSSHEVQKRAYEIFLENGCQAGKDLEHWLQAEKEIFGKNVKVSAPKKKAVTSTKNK
ncbi:MAG: DUF2934 domain-containing protein [Candidatus Margulisiibacteriota bacterium]|jgi:hypothetical protein